MFSWLTHVNSPSNHHFHASLRWKNPHGPSPFLHGELRRFKKWDLPGPAVSIRPPVQEQLAIDRPLLWRRDPTDEDGDMKMFD